MIACSTKSPEKCFWYVISLHWDRMYKIPPATSFFRNARESTPFSFIDMEKTNQYNKASPQETQKTGTSREANYSQKTRLISTSWPPRQCHQTAKLQASSNSWKFLHFSQARWTEAQGGKELSLEPHSWRTNVQAPKATTAGESPVRRGAGRVHPVP
jgi:hypothetical protein